MQGHPLSRVVWNRATEFQTYHALRQNKVFPSISANSGWWPFLELHGGGVEEAPWLPESLRPYLKLEAHSFSQAPCQLLLFSRHPTSKECLWKLVGYTSTTAYLHVRSPPPHARLSLSRAHTHPPCLPPPLLSFRRRTRPTWSGKRKRKPAPSPGSSVWA